jgi:hypothetical protein
MTEFMNGLLSCAPDAKHWSIADVGLDETRRQSIDPQRVYEKPRRGDRT